MFKKSHWAMVLAGLAAGAVTGLLGAGGGMLLVPLLSALTDLENEEIFSASLGIILPICLVSLAFSGTPAWREAIIYLPGSALGGYLAGKFGKKIPTLWLHKGLGLLIVYGGIRYLW